MKTQFRKLNFLLPLYLFISLFIFTLCTEEPFEPEITGSIEGKVVDAETNKPIANVTLTTKPSTEVVLTDAEGNFQFASVDTGRYNVMAEKKDYETKMLGVLIKEDQAAQVHFLLNKTDNSQLSSINFSKSFTPESGVENQPPNVTLSWKAQNNENETDSIYYDVRIFSSNSLHELFQVQNIRDTFLTLTGLQYNKIYYWQVTARNENGDTARSQLLNFKTRSISPNSFFFVERINGNYEVMAYDPDNNLSNRLTYNGYRDWAPKINRRTDQIAFTSDSLVKTYIYTIDRNGGDIQKITNIEVDGYHNEGNAFAWDEDAGKLIFSHYNELYEINSDGTSLNKLATAPAGRHFREVDLSPDYQKIVALTIGEKVYHSEIYLMERDGSNPQVLIDSLEGIVESPSFSIDGESILFTHDVSGNEALDGRMLNSHIFRLDIATMDTTDLSTNKPLGTNDLQPTYSPTGDKIVFMNVVNDNSKPKEIWMMDVDGTNREKIIDDAEQPHWN